MWSSFSLPDAPLPSTDMIHAFKATAHPTANQFVVEINMRRQKIKLIALGPPEAPLVLILKLLSLKKILERKPINLKIGPPIK